MKNMRDADWKDSFEKEMNNGSGIKRPDPFTNISKFCCLNGAQ